MKGWPTTLSPALGVFLWTRIAMWVLAAGALVLFDDRLNPDRSRSGFRDFHDVGPVVDVWARWDSGWFLKIADEGYSWPSSTPAFFPLYPVLVRCFSVALGGHDIVAGVLVSTLAGVAAFELVFVLARERLGPQGGWLAVLYLGLFPTAFFLAAVYSESLFLALAAGAFLAADRGRATTCALLAGFAMLTRAQGVALLPLVAITAWRSGGPRSALREIVVSCAVFAVYPLTLWAWIDRPLAFLEGQRVWERHLSPFGPFGGVADAISEADIVSLAFAAVMILLAASAWRRFGPGLGSYALLTLLLPMAVPSERLGGLYSFERFAVVAFPCFMALAAVTGGRRLAIVAYSTVSAALLAYYVVRWSLWNWVA